MLNLKTCITYACFTNTKIQVNSTIDGKRGRVPHLAFSSCCLKCRESMQSTKTYDIFLQIHLLKHSIRPDHQSFCYRTCVCLFLIYVVLVTELLYNSNRDDIYTSQFKKD